MESRCFGRNTRRLHQQVKSQKLMDIAMLPCYKQTLEEGRKILEDCFLNMKKQLMYVYNAMKKPQNGIQIAFTESSDKKEIDFSIKNDRPTDIKIYSLYPSLYGFFAIGNSCNKFLEHLAEALTKEADQKDEAKILIRSTMVTPLFLDFIDNIFSPFISIQNSKNKVKLEEFEGLCIKYKDDIPYITYKILFGQDFQVLNEKRNSIKTYFIEFLKVLLTTYFKAPSELTDFLDKNQTEFFDFLKNSEPNYEPKTLFLNEQEEHAFNNQDQNTIDNIFILADFELNGSKSPQQIKDVTFYRCKFKTADPPGATSKASKARQLFLDSDVLPVVRDGVEVDFQSYYVRNRGLLSKLGDRETYFKEIRDTEGCRLSYITYSKICNIPIKQLIEIRKKIDKSLERKEKNLCNVNINYSNHPTYGYYNDLLLCSIQNTDFNKIIPEAFKFSPKNSDFNAFEYDLKKQATDEKDIIHKYYSYKVLYKALICEQDPKKIYRYLLILKNFQDMEKEEDIRYNSPGILYMALKDVYIKKDQPPQFIANLVHAAEFAKSCNQIKHYNEAMMYTFLFGINFTIPSFPDFIKSITNGSLNEK
ncbi:hypothetical protein TVAG_106540 [Trichomonas vaginalis G3]|uniref:Uncharacterized protein n=1 Tax=Trichomonas vaginalis (strain ATCC PRA-98 / G3) TaxID=412133 RepID=A2E6E6_TRIV3|nr:hypothetical protein TVAGG3_0039990 [Trichomonas vaginalis G3]EAY11759.1 hypothetical protein TVAG_106540 [Trichomonas vaginalis G3]KAI5540630.1 hypothetical protein TVAGG3_0039990 [Trichomonas vaginalis G3]|eukprot:XP_001323982.1 hypothetical protein [Trichomonas vaginalis G3]